MTPLEDVVAKLSERDREILDEVFLCDGGTRWLRPMDCGGCDSSDHSYRMSKLARLGLAETRQRGALGFGRGSKEYRLTDLGTAAQAFFNKDKDNV